MHGKLRLAYATSRDYDEVHRRLEWYERVSKDLRPAKYRVAKRLPCDVDLAQASDDSLWGEHERLSAESLTVLEKLKSGSLDFTNLPVARPSFMDLKVRILSRIISRCTLCEWKCKVDRVAFTKRGACKLNATSRVSTWFLHFGEEPPLVGRGGSGTIFFSSCNFRCAFCQNWDISQDPTSGAPVDVRRLALIMKNLRAEGALNINFVGGEPTPNLHTIVGAMSQIDVNVPMLWNSNMYCSEETMRILADVIDIWLPDFKYGNDKCAIRLSRVPRYFEVASRNHEYAQANGDMIIRHLVLPNHIECCTKPVLRWISEHCPRALVNIMGQYHPDNRVPYERSTYTDISRRPTAEEMQAAYDFADSLGLVYSPVS